MLIRPYGDTTDDGAVQLSFTLPIANGARAREAAEAFCRKLGFTEAQVVQARSLSEEFTFFVVYGRTEIAVELDELQITESEIPTRSREAWDALAQERIGRPLVVVGACTGTDAHTVGLDAILNAKGFHGVPGLERYRAFQVHNLGSQVENGVLVQALRDLHADVVLVSQVVTQKDVHLKNLEDLVQRLQEAGLRDTVLLIAGGPRLSQGQALKLGYDAGFGPATTPAEVAAFILHGFLQRLEQTSPTLRPMTP